MKRHLLSRRQFTARCAAFGLSIPTLSAVLASKESAQERGGTASAKAVAAQVKLPDGTSVTNTRSRLLAPGPGRHPPAVEEEAPVPEFRRHDSLDTSGNYGGGLNSF